MNFTTAWANIAKQNVNLKVALVAVTICTIFLGYSTVSLSLKDSVVIERGCFSKAVDVTSAKQTNEEIKTFIGIALKQRFDTNTQVIEGYLSLDERNLKEKEQLDLKKKGLEQIVVLRKVTIANESIMVEADRLYSIQNVRSTFPIKLNLSLETKQRTETNPYGLILVKTEELKEGEKNESK